MLIIQGAWFDVYVHPVKFVVENPTVNGDTCLQVLREMQSILISRGFENGFTIPAN